MAKIKSVLTVKETKKEEGNQKQSAVNKCPVCGSRLIKMVDPQDNKKRIRVCSLDPTHYQEPVA